MDTAAYLRKHGWQGTGHSLHPEKTHAIKKPLLVSKKIDVLGLGQNKHATVSDQWWLRAFDSSLKDFGSGKKSVLSSVKEAGVKQGGLYGHFVAGQGFPGTIQDSSVSTDIQLDVKMTVKRKAEDEAPYVNGQDKKLKTVTDTMSHVHADRQMAMNSAVDGPAPTQEQKPVKKLSAKAEKYAREKAKREAKRAARAQLGGSGANSISVDGKRIRKEPTDGADEPRKDPKEVAKARASEKARKKQIKQEKIIAKREAKKRKAAFTVEKRARRRAMLAEKFAARAKEDADVSIEPTIATGPEVNTADNFAAGADIISLSGSKPKPRSGRKAAKPDPDIARAQEFGMPLEDYKSLPVSNYKKQKTLMTQLQNLDEAKKARYTDRANEKGQTLEHYFMARMTKNLAAAGLTDDVVPSTVDQPAELEFAIDTAGDSSLTVTGDQKMLHVKQLAKLPAEEALEVIDPETWAGKVVKDLPKDLRETRRIWMLARRTIKHNKRVEAGTAKRRKGEGGGQTRHEMKEKRLQGLMLDVLRHSRRAVFGGPADAQDQSTENGADTQQDGDEPPPDKLFERVKKGHKDKHSVGMRGEEDMHGNPLPPLKEVANPKLGPDGQPLPVINISTTSGQYTEGEMKAARRAARRIIRHEKQANKRGPNSTKKIGKRRGRKN